MASPVSTTHLRNLDETGQNVSNGGCHVKKLVLTNSSAAVAWVQIFDLAAADVTLGTTRPLVSIPLAATSGFADLDFELAGWFFATRFSVFSTTTQEGSTGSADGVMLQAWIN